MQYRLWTAGAAMALGIGCVGGGDGTSSSSTQFDATTDCTKWLACDDVGVSLDECVSSTSSWYNELSEAGQAEVDKGYAACAGKNDCDYVDCTNEAVDWDMLGEGDLGTEACLADVTADSTTVPYGDGNLEFASAEVLFWVNFEGCLTEVDIELTQGECTLRVSAKDFTNSEGQLLIRDASLRAGGLCPGFPDAIENASFGYNTFADDGTLGTVEVVTPSGDWNGCEEGEVILHSQLILENFDSPALDLTGWTMRFTGTLAQTHTSLDDPCPTEYF